MLADWAHLIVPDRLHPPFASETVTEGADYARSGRVHGVSWNPRTIVAEAQCADSAEVIRQTSVRFRAVGDLWRISGTRCTCPQRRFCVHGAAVALSLRTLVDDGAVPAPAGWETELAALVTDDDDSVSDTEATPALFARVLSDPRAAGGASVSVRPTLVWSDGREAADLSWSTLLSMDPEEIRAGADATRLHALRDLARVVVDDGGDARSWTSLSRTSESFWEAFATVVSAQVRLLPDGDGPAVHTAGVATLTVSVVGVDSPDDGPADVTVRTELLVDGSPVAPGAGALLGTPTPAAVQVYDGTRVVIATLSPRPAPALAAMFAADKVVRVPGADVPRFVAETLPRITARVPTRYDNTEFGPPEVTGPVPVLALHLESEPYRVDWRMRYRVNDSPVDFHPDHPVTGAIRDEVAEENAWERAKKTAVEVIAIASGWPVRMIALAQQRMRAGDPAGQHDAQLLRTARNPAHAASLVDPRLLRGPVALTEVEAARLVVEMLPELRESADVEIEVVGDLPDFRYAATDPGIRFTHDGTTTAVRPADAPDADWHDLDVVLDVDGHAVAVADVIGQLAKGATHMLTPARTYFRIDTPEVQKLAALLEEAETLGDVTATSTTVGRYADAGLWAELFELGVVDAQIRRWRDNVVALAAPPAPVAVPEQLTVDLRPYQRTGLDWLAMLWDNQIGGILADDMGLGKTIQTLALIARARGDGSASAPFLVVAPTSVVSNWVSECARVTPDLTSVAITSTEAAGRAALVDRIAGADVVVTSYALFRIDFAAYADQHWAGLILDEAQFVKNHNAKVHQCARRLDVAFTLAITGTPLENSLMELWALTAIVAPGLLGSAKYFYEQYRKPVESGTDPNRLHALRRRIRPFLLRRTKSEVVDDLPEKQEQVVRLRLAPTHRRRYDVRLARERQQVLGLLGEWERHRFAIFRSLTTMRQLSLHAGLVDPAADGVPSAKIDHLVRRLPELVAEGHSALVFSQFTGFLALLRDRLDAEDIGYGYLDGSMSSRRRDAEVARLRSGETRVFLISLKAGGFGLNLTEADYCFICDPWWNPATEAQAVDRTHRIGQRRAVTVYRLVSADTVEEKVIALQERKQELFDAVLHGAERFDEAVSPDDVRALLSD
ncbi:DEAD/DEAH box helicase [Williamsia sterculiae]|uniref:Superfamily II DNA or RNA helicase, SNF2 family n=1 Tax=Williamsia sterculiae TaxID=1344003 RepID=A0A1N7G971_9NOCA|nr:DEAD/DEAH box helicase [Williamsia sterculiae]SIS09064.1 Superfamily II DNA or RNA helicase, SNF2 family [Williamsia sterculiae]